MRFDDRVTGKFSRPMPKQAKVIHFEIDPAAEIDKNVKTDVAVLGDAKASLSSCYYHLLRAKTPILAWHQEFKDLYAIEYDSVITTRFASNQRKA